MYLYMKHVLLCFFESQIMYDLPEGKSFVKKRKEKNDTDNIFSLN